MDATDARFSYVSLASSGKRMLTESQLASDLLIKLGGMVL